MPHLAVAELPPRIILAMALGLHVLLASTLAYAAFALDKHRAISAGWRLSERGLLMLAAVGGWPGAKLAQHRLRHKTRKEPFRSRLNRIGATQAVILVLLSIPLPTPDWPGMLLSPGLPAPAGGKPEAGQEPHRSARPMPHRFGPGATMP